MRVFKSVLINFNANARGFLTMDFLHSQFQGCLAGVLVGDAYGYPFELKKKITDKDVQDFFEKKKKSTSSREELKYSDDSSMTWSVLRSLIECQCQITPSLLAKRFCDQYFQHEVGTKRQYSYGNSVVSIFDELRKSNYLTPFGPASKTFGGAGSHANGAAMRISPVALVSHSSSDSEQGLVNLVEMTCQASRITHSNAKGICGAIFQACAVRQALIFGQLVNEDKTSIKDKENINMDILQGVKSDLEVIDQNKWNFVSYQYISGGMKEYLRKLEIIKGFISDPSLPTNTDVIAKLGVSLKAEESVPTAFYCFLTSFKINDRLTGDSQFEKCIQYAIKLGGDTDTIASMAGAICGSFLGIDHIPKVLSRHCEKFNDILTDGTNLYDAFNSKLKTIDSKS